MAIVVVPPAVYVTSDDDGRDKAGAGKVEGSGGTLSTGSRRPRVIDEQDALSVEQSQRLVAPRIESSRLHWKISSDQQSLVPASRRTDEFSDHSAQWMVLVAPDVT